MMRVRVGLETRAAWNRKAVGAVRQEPGLLRYRYDERTMQRSKTVELIIGQSSWQRGKGRRRPLNSTVLHHSVDRGTGETQEPEHDHGPISDRFLLTKGVVEWGCSCRVVIILPATG